MSPRFGTFLLALLAATLAATGTAADTKRLTRITHIHGLAVDPAATDHLFLATRKGFYRLAPDGLATLVSAGGRELTGFAAVAGNRRFFASGKVLRAKETLGILRSDNAGTSWRKISDGLVGASAPAAFRRLAVSPSNPRLLFGLDDNLQVSRDGGMTWTQVGPAPKSVLGMALAAGAGARLYVATPRGLLASSDGGKTWAPAYGGKGKAKIIATLVTTTPDGRIFAHIHKQGLMMRNTGGSWRQLVAAKAFDGMLIRLAVDPQSPQHLYVVSQYMKIFESRDGGKTWTRYGL
ncbi:MAG: hypothetical protein QF797_01455 [Alphaproteobacteria bacterium]|jgi:hypothetical protein|nr:hypothetical protein [Alphaproteobacteria bacterium]MDP6624006.1 hypothetical protein [Alphaproteobacteria bacterium]|tara:strand:- start:2897 stop:3775 length:879 start_codon:yes stop_codon:yes gene_type:complete